MPAPSFVSFAQNREDVVLWRALHAVDSGRYVDVGANDPADMSVTRGFYEHGWSGLTIDPVVEYVDAHRAQRPRDRQVNAAVTDLDEEEVRLHVFPDTGLSTLVDDVSERHLADGRDGQERVVPARRLDALLDEAGWAGQDVHFVVVDVEGAEDQVLRSIDLERWRPWVFVVESTAPLSTTQTHGRWEQTLLDARYTFCLFDGISRYYVAEEHPELVADLSYPACALDDFDTRTARTLRDTAEVTRGELVRWRTAALTRWAEAVAEHSSPALEARTAALEAEIVALRETLSWRVTRPLRAARRLMPR